MINLSKYNIFQKALIIPTLPHFYSLNIIIATVLTIFSGMMVYKAFTYFMVGLYWSTVIDGIIAIMFLLLAVVEFKTFLAKFFYYKTMKTTGRESELEIKFK